MDPYAHYYLAARLESHFAPTDPAQYRWGSVIPDIRYVAQMQRKTTHQVSEKLEAWQTRYPHLDSFLLGYRVHLQLDEIDVALVLQKAFPLNIISKIRRRPFSSQQLGVLAGLYFIQRPAPAAFTLACDHNPVLAELGVTPEQTALYATAMREFLSAPSFDSAFSAYQRLGMIDNQRVAKYAQVAQSFQKKPLLRSLLLLGVKNSHLERKSLDFVKHSIQNSGSD